MFLGLGDGIWLSFMGLWVLLLYQIKAMTEIETRLGVLDGDGWMGGWSVFGVGQEDYAWEVKWGYRMAGRGSSEKDRECADE